MRKNEKNDLKLKKKYYLRCYSFLFLLYERFLNI